MSDAERMIKHLNKVIAVDHDAIAAYESAIERLDDAGLKDRLAEFRDDHRHHVRDLGNAVRNQGGEPPNSGDLKQVLTRGKVVMADLAGDRSILKAMKSNEDQTNQTYENALEREWPEPIRKMLEGGLADERRHRAWLVQTIDRMGLDEAHRSTQRDPASGGRPHGPNR